jgi:hypothetical protein
MLGPTGFITSYRRSHPRPLCGRHDDADAETQQRYNDFGGCSISRADRHGGFAIGRFVPTLICFANCVIGCAADESKVARPFATNDLQQPRAPNVQSRLVHHRPSAARGCWLGRWEGGREAPIANPDQPALCFAAALASSSPQSCANTTSVLKSPSNGKKSSHCDCR